MKVKLFGDKYILIHEEETIFTVHAYGEIALTDSRIERLVALWNMAEELNLSTEAIESGVVKDMLEALKELIKSNYGQPGAVHVPMLDKARAAIAKAEGREG